MWITGLFGLIGSAVSGFFGSKKTQGETIQTGLNVLSDINSSAADKEGAIASIITSETTNGYWLAAMWRPMAMVIFLAIIVSFWFGYVPPQLEAEMPPMVAELFSLIKLGLMGYIPARTVEKVIDKLQLGSILKTYISKNV